MLPIYENYLNFTPEMIAIILALNVVLDPLITSCNVMANGALCRVFEKVWGFVQAFLIPSRVVHAPRDFKIGTIGENYESLTKTDHS